MNHNENETRNLTRRGLLTAAALAGGGALLTRGARAAPMGNTPPLTAKEMAAVDSALGKKGKYVESEAT